MRQQLSAHTGPEVALRKELHRRGLRFRVQFAILDRRRRHDIVFTRAKVVVEVLGCFWHSCPIHGTCPRANADRWRKKLDGNVLRDKRTAQQLRELGWTVIHVWEHDDPYVAANLVESEVTEARTKYVLAPTEPIVAESNRLLTGAVPSEPRRKASHAV